MCVAALLLVACTAACSGTLPCRQGMWSKGKPHGPGRYVWAAGPEYDGEWVGGAMHGKGTLKVCVWGGVGDSFLTAL